MFGIAPGMGVYGLSTIPEKFNLNQNFPYPFNLSTTISYEIPKGSYVEITIYGISGNEVRNLFKAYQSIDHESTHWNATNNHGQLVSAEVYFSKMSVEKFTDRKK